MPLVRHQQDLPSSTESFFSLNHDGMQKILGKSWKSFLKYLIFCKVLKIERDEVVPGTYFFM